MRDLAMNYYVYILASKPKGVLYIGFSNDLVARVYEHREELVESFTKKYHVHKLVYYEVFHRIEEAIGREKQIKAGSRKKKEELVNSINSEWKDLFAEISEW